MTDVRIEPWHPSDLPLLQLLNSPAMTAHLGGPESDEAVANRHQRYLADRTPGSGQMYHILVMPDRAKAGSVGFWGRTWLGLEVYEMGWGVLPEFQGRGVATAAAAAVVEAARAAGDRRFLHAYPSVENGASNALCTRLGFTLLGACDFEYPPGHPMPCNDWQLDLIG